MEAFDLFNDAVRQLFTQAPKAVQSLVCDLPRLLQQQVTYRFDDAGTGCPILLPCRGHGSLPF
jgi:hypothetical protein